LLPERFREHHLKYRADYLVSPETRPIGRQRDLYGRRKDGTTIPLDIGLNPIHTGTETLVLAAVIDITERKRAEDALRVSHERLDWVVHSTELGLWYS